MIIEQTIQKMLTLKLGSMATAFRTMAQRPDITDMTFEEKFGLLIDHEWTERENRRLERRLREAKLGVRACLDEIVCDPARGIDKAVMRQFQAGDWIRNTHNVLILGSTGVGKTFVASSLADVACRLGYRAFFVRMPRLLEELALARVSGTYGSTLAKLAKFDVLIIDDFLLAPMSESERRDLLEVLEDRYAKSCTVITSQLPTKNWHQALGEPTLADAICDRLVHNAHILALKGPSMRKSKGLNNTSQNH